MRPEMDAMTRMVRQASRAGVHVPCSRVEWAQQALAADVRDRALAAAACSSCDRLTACAHIADAAPPSAGVAAGVDYGPVGAIGPRCAL